MPKLKTVIVSDQTAPDELDDFDYLFLRRKDEACRNWSFLIYPEWEDFSTFYNRILYSDCVYFISPLHLDLKADGQEAKPHHHVLVLFKNARKASAIRSLFGFAENFAVFQLINPLGAIRYLCHYGREDKKQYPRELIVTNNQFMLNRAFSMDSRYDEALAVQVLNDVLRHNVFECEWDLELYCIEHGLDGIYRKCRYSIHSSWEILQLRAKRNIIDMRVLQSRFIEPDHYYEDEQLSWEDILNGSKE